VTSSVSREQIEDALVSAGVRSPVVRDRLLRVIDVYALQRARCACLEEADLPAARKLDKGGKKPRWKCPECTNILISGEFPQKKRDNPRIAIACLRCQELTGTP
jgi:hypothetical protein